MQMSLETQLKKRILIAEDNEINLKVLVAILRQLPIDYVIAKDGLEALQLYRSQDVGLILMDCQMPNLDGYQSTLKIREFETNQQRARCPIIALTANAMSGDKEKCLKTGMDDFISKPYKKDELIKAVLKWLEPTSIKESQ